MKKTIFRLITLLAMVSFLSLPVAAQVVSIDPSEFNSPAEGGQFTVSVKIADAVNLYAFAADLKFDPQAVQVATGEADDELVVGDETEPQGAEPEPSIKLGDFLKSDGNPAYLLLPNDVDNENGLIDDILLLRVGSPDGVDGNGVLLTITFEVLKSDVESALELENVQLSSPEAEKTTAQTIVNGTIKPYEGEVEKGDVNGDGQILPNDALLTLQIFVGSLDPTEQQKLAADMNDDGSVLPNDALAILQEFVSPGAPSLLSSRSVKSFKFQIGNFEGVAGQKSSTLLKVDQPQALGSTGITITYDSTILLATDVEPAKKDMLLAVNLSKPGVIRLATANLKASENSSLATIHFDVLRDDKAELKLKDIKSYGFDIRPITATGINGKFTSPLMVPDKSILRQNFPNPFNPETWIPYQLKDAGRVVISIYDISGRIIRQFDLGYQPAGIYSTPTRAIHWDGRNASGEQVTSGLYFYTLKTESFAQTRRMILIK